MVDGGSTIDGSADLINDVTVSELFRFREKKIQNLKLYLGFFFYIMQFRSWNLQLTPKSWNRSKVSSRSHGVSLVLRCCFRLRGEKCELINVSQSAEDGSETQTLWPNTAFYSLMSEERRPKECFYICVTVWRWIMKMWCGLCWLLLGPWSSPGPEWFCPLL